MKTYEFLDKKGTVLMTIKTNNPDNDLAFYKKQSKVIKYREYREPALTLKEVKTIQEETINNSVAAAIIGGFSCILEVALIEDGFEIKNKAVFFDSSVYDQNNFGDQQLLVVSGLASDILVVRGLIDGYKVKKAMRVSQKVYLDIIKALGDHKQSCLEKGWEFKTLIQKAETVEEVQAIVWTS